MSPTRRTTLKTTALTLGGGTFAGCLGGSVPTGGTTPDETSTRPTTRDEGQTERTAATDFRDWLPDPRNTPFGDGYGVRYFDAAAIRERRGDLHDNAYERLEAEMLDAGPNRTYVDDGAVTATLSVGFDVSVAFGSFDPDAVRERYVRERARRGTASTATTHAPGTETHTPEVEPEQYAGFDLFGTNGAYAVSEDAIIDVGYVHEGDPREYAQAIVDARSEGTTTYVDANEYVNAMLGLVDGSHALKCYPEAMDGSTSRGFRKDAMTGGLKAWRFGNETTRLTYANTYPGPETAKAADVEAYVDAESARFGPYDGLDVRTDGRMVWTTGTIPTDEFDYLSPGGPGDGVHTPNG